MIFRQWQQVLNGEKTQTRRIEQAGDRLVVGNVLSGKGRVRFAFGQSLPIIPKRGQKAIRDEEGNIQRVVISSIRREYLQDIDEADAKAEGVNSVEEYRALWQSINGKTKGARWEDNPLVFVITFGMVKVSPMNHDDARPVQEDA